MARRKRTSRARRKRGGDKLAGWFILLCLFGGGLWLAWKSDLWPGRTPVPDPTRVTPVPPSVPRPASVPPLIAPPPVEAAPVLPPPDLKPPPGRGELAGPGPSGFPRPPQSPLEAQVALTRRIISPGSIDGVLGSQTRAALRTFQRQQGLLETGELDAPTRSALTLLKPPLTRYVITPDDLARLQPLSKTWLGKSQQTALDYESLLELVAERGQASPYLIRRLNPGVDWTNAVPGTEVQIPDVAYPAPFRKAGFVVISLGEKQLQAFDANTNLLAHFPCSIAARVEKRPAGELRVIAIAEDPNYTFNPEIFPDSVEGRELGRKLILPPGPNNPVGTAWISLNLPSYGIHGTPAPEQVGRTESSGCFRLANWNASHLVKLVWVGMPVYVTP